MASMIASACCDCWICTTTAAWLDDRQARTAEPTGAAVLAPEREPIERIVFRVSAFGRS
jgi:hypothetical protein